MGAAKVRAQLKATFKASSVTIEMRVWTKSSGGYRIGELIVNSLLTHVVRSMGADKVRAQLKATFKASSVTIEMRVWTKSSGGYRIG